MSERSRREILRSWVGAAALGSTTALAGCNSTDERPTSDTSSSPPPPQDLSAEVVDNETATFAPRMDGVSREERNVVLAVEISGYEAAELRVNGQPYRRFVPEEGERYLDIAEDRIVVDSHLYRDGENTATVVGRRAGSQVGDSERVGFTVRIPVGFQIDVSVPDDSPLSTVQTYSTAFGHDDHRYAAGYSNRVHESDVFPNFVQDLKENEFDNLSQVESASSLDEFADYVQKDLTLRAVEEGGYGSIMSPISAYAWEMAATMETAYNSLTDNSATFSAWNNVPGHHGGYAGYDFATGDVLAFAIGNEGISIDTEYHWKPMNSTWRNRVATYFWYPLSNKYEEDYETLGTDTSLAWNFRTLKTRTKLSIMGFVYDDVPGASTPDFVLFTDEFLTELRDLFMSGTIEPRTFRRLREQLRLVLDVSRRNNKRWAGSSGDNRENSIVLIVSGSVDDPAVFRLARWAKGAGDNGPHRVYERLWDPEYRYDTDSLAADLDKSHTEIPTPEPQTEVKEDGEVVTITTVAPKENPAYRENPVTFTPANRTETGDD